MVRTGWLVMQAVQSHQVRFLECAHAGRCSEGLLLQIDLYYKLHVPMCQTL